MRLQVARSAKVPYLLDSMIELSMLIDSARHLRQGQSFTALRGFKLVLNLWNGSCLL